MAELLTLHEVLRKEGLEFIHKLFDGFVIISEKLNATRFGFEKSKNGELTFYRKDGKITVIERTLNQLFEEPINYIANLPKETLEKIPTGYRFGLRYFHSMTPINIHYDRLPLNGLVLTDVRSSDTDKLIDDVSILNALSDLLMVEKPPIIWHGKLDDAQKTRLLDYLRTPEDRIQKKFEISSFTKYIISILNPSMKKTSLGNSIDSPIDSVVFKFLGKEKNETFYAKAVDPMVQMINKTNEQDRDPQDMYGIILSDIVEFILLEGVKKYNPEGSSTDEKFISLICQIYNTYIKKNGYKFEGVELNSLSFNSIPKFDLNTGLIPDLKTRNLIKLSSINKNIFKIMVSGFSKPRKTPSGTVTQMLIDDLKLVIHKIKAKIDSTSQGVEEGLVTFKDFLKKKTEKSWVIKD
jgi:hypothetical protein